jgi:type IV pilus assembly protein PilC
MSPLLKPQSIPASAPIRAEDPSSKKQPVAAPSAMREKRLAARGRVAGAAKIVSRDLPAFSRQLAAMLSAGMPIVTCLETLEEQAGNVNFKALIGEVREGIEGGLSLSESMSKFPSVFDDLYINMLKGGEASGTLAETISRLASLIEESAKLKRKVKSAMTYPVIVLTIALTITSGLILFIVPVFANMFKDFGAKLPAPTQFLVDLSNNFRKGAPIVFPLLFVLGIVFNKWKKTPVGHLAVDAAVLKAPIFGPLALKVSVARFARILSQLVKSGVPIMDALSIVAGATGNKVIENAVMRGRDCVERGEPLSAGLGQAPQIPKMLIRMLAAGEKTGKVDEMMDSIADFYEDEVQTMIAGLTSMIEPLLMVFLGVIVGGIMVCMFLPIFRMAEAIKM